MSVGNHYRNTRIFYAVFFGAIFLSFASIYYSIFVLGDYYQFQSCDERPEPYHFYLDPERELGNCNEERL